MGEWLEGAIAAIEGASSVDELKSVLQSSIEHYGFAAFSFLDGARPGDDDPTVVNSILKAFDTDYRSEGLLAVDPCLPVWRRTNRPFTWGSIPLPERLGKRLPGALKTMTVARDHGYREGFVIPFHYVDRLGRPFSSICTLFWTDLPVDFNRKITEIRIELHIIFVYWAQRVVDLLDSQKKRPSRFLGSDGEEQDTIRLTDRERDVLSWAGRGKTVPETAVILSLSDDTVETHIRNAMRKIGANTKTQAVAKAIMLNAIDI